MSDDSLTILNFLRSHEDHFRDGSIFLSGYSGGDPTDLTFDLIDRDEIGRRLVARVPDNPSIVHAYRALIELERTHRVHHNISDEAIYAVIRPRPARELLMEATSCTPTPN